MYLNQFRSSRFIPHWMEETLGYIKSIYDQKLNLIFSFLHAFQTISFINFFLGALICSKLTIKTPEQHHWHCSGIFIGNFELILHHFLVFLLLFWTSKCWLGSKFFDWHCEINLVLKSLKSAYKGINFTCAVELQLMNFVGIF